MYISEFCEVKYMEELNVVFVKWKKFCSGNDYREPLLFALSILREYEGCNYVADTRNGFENEYEDTQWIFSEFIPAAAKTSCKMVIFIISQDNKLKEELEGQSVEIKKYFKVKACFSLEEVKHILQE